MVRDGFSCLEVDQKQHDNHDVPVLKLNLDGFGYSRYCCDIGWHVEETPLSQEPRPQLDTNNTKDKEDEETEQKNIA